MMGMGERLRWNDTIVGIYIYDWEGVERMGGCRDGYNGI